MILRYRQSLRGMQNRSMSDQKETPDQVQQSSRSPSKNRKPTRLSRKPQRHAVIKFISSAVIVVVFVGSFNSGLLTFWEVGQNIIIGPVDLLRSATRPSYMKVLHGWNRNQIKFIRANGRPGGEPEPIGVLWYQFFDRGLILHNSTHGWSVILFFDSKTWERVDNPGSLISQHHQQKLNRKLFDEIIPGTVGVEEKEEYWRLITEKNIIGGIGTTYVSQGLLTLLGQNEHLETPFHHAAYIDGPPYQLILNLTNRATDDPNRDTNRSVVVLKPDGTFVRNLVRIEAGNKFVSVLAQSIASFKFWLATIFVAVLVGLIFPRFRTFLAYEVLFRERRD